MSTAAQPDTQPDTRPDTPRPAGASPDPAADPVLLEVADGVALLTLNRPDRLNAVDSRLMARFLERLDEAADDEAVRVVVVTGAGRGFCAGADLSVLEDLGTGEQQVAMPGMAYMAARSLPKPVIAAVNGPCAGLGLIIALTCDLRFATPRARFGTGFARIGLVAEQGLAWLLPRVVGPSRAMDLLLSARLFDGDEAERIGLVDGLHEPEDLLPAVLAYARDLAAGSSPVSMGVIKWQVQRALETSLEQAMEDADPLTRVSLRGRDFVEVGSRLRAGERPAYPPLPSGAPRLGAEPPTGLVPPAT
ncbi:enoyl-CoA hydratase-related protein [Nocardioides zeae]|uniref:Enoyl-CoA hydratase-related protein n=1 Tax=Nocardioides imazamoxiresistens TaxID=3231893 RepID=A0ABU3PR14_9ACTN|nr:enoyl-CoA hydratase-related protein [Nocardioides zeae]MDT9591669.1 enoyl-CoA hydratase-related protein [Nocardioides zeae]